MISNKANKENENLNILEDFEQSSEFYIQQYPYIQKNIEDVKGCRNMISILTNKLANITDTTPQHALIGIAALFQSGAYLKNITNRKITISNKTFDKINLISILEQQNNQYTLRQLARSINTTIAKIAIQSQIPGHLYAQFKLENPSILAEKTPGELNVIAAYCTDFQIDNPDIPPIVRDFLSNRARNRKINR